MAVIPPVAHVDPSSSDLATLLSYRLSVVSNLLSRSQLRRFEAIYDISQLEWRVLVLVNSYGPLSVKSLSKHAALDFGQTSRLVSRLFDDGLIIKKPTDDARSVNLTLTAKGRALHRRLWKVVTQCNNDFLGSLSDVEQRVLMTALDTLTAKAKALMEPNLHRAGKVAKRA